MIKMLIGKKGLNLCLGLFLAASAASVSSQTTVYQADPYYVSPLEQSYGVRVGFGVGPDQFVFGPSAEIGQIFEYAYFAPSLDLGFGDNATVVALNPDLRVRLFSPPGSQAIIFLGAGPSLAFVSPQGGDNKTEVGFSLTAGLKFPMGVQNYYDIETRIGLGDLPEVKVMFGLMFGGREHSETDRGVLDQSRNR
ncbi:MAG: hypothetical protein SGI97_00295 [candidate division Zixibacteria bacterium]|nr:hypothetical protein [candidate division Zixibacteria bacterium]